MADSGRTVIGAMAVRNAQKRGTELLTRLIEGFTANQTASYYVITPSPLQAWIGVATALITLLIANFFG